MNFNKCGLKSRWVLAMRHVAYDALYDTMGYSIILCDTLWYSMILWDTLWYPTVLYDTLRYYAILCNTIQEASLYDAISNRRVFNLKLFDYNFCQLFFVGKKELSQVLLFYKLIVFYKKKTISGLNQLIGQKNALQNFIQNL